MTNKHVTKELLRGSRFSLDTVHIQAGNFVRFIFASISSLPYCKAVGVFSVHESHDGCVTVIDVAGGPTRRNKSYRVRFEESFTRELITRRRNSDRFEKYVDVSYL